MTQNVIGSFFSPTKEEQKEAGIRFKKKLQEKGYSMDELEPVLDAEAKSTLILSCAGSGKTTALKLRLLYRKAIGALQKEDGTDKKVLVCTYLKTGAQELERGIYDLAKEFEVPLAKGVVEVKTIHAEAVSYIKQQGLRLNIVDNLASDIKIVAKEMNIKSSRSYARTLGVEEYKDLASLVSYTRNRLDSAKYTNPLLAVYGLQEGGLDTLLTKLKLLRKVRREVDFEDLQEILLEALQQSEQHAKNVGSRYDVVYVDEFQDTSQLQYAILKYYFDGSQEVFVIGDDDQCIYGWRGSDVNIMRKDFVTDYEPLTLELTVNYRCKSRILSCIVPMIGKNINRYKKDLKAANEGGSVEIHPAQDVSLLVSQVQSDIAKGRTVGILGRTNASLTVPALLLALETDMPFTLSEGVYLTQGVGQIIFGALDLMIKGYSSDFRTILSGFLNYKSKKESAELCRVLETNGLTVQTVNLADIQVTLPAIYPVIEIIQRYKEEPKKGYCALLHFLREKVYVSENMYAQRARILAGQMISIVETNPRVQDLTMFELSSAFRYYIPTKLQGIKKKKNNQVSLSTVHNAKGKEWDTVYLLEVGGGSYPSNPGKRELTYAEIEEERRVFYIAWTRAKERLVVYRGEGEAGFFNDVDTSAVIYGEGLEQSTYNATQDLQKAEQTIEEMLLAYIAVYMKPTYATTYEGSMLRSCLETRGVATIVEELYRLQEIQEIDLLSFSVEEQDRRISVTIESLNQRAKEKEVG